jgi:hypothetical protein
VLTVRKGRAGDPLLAGVVRVWSVKTMVVVAT